MGNKLLDRPKANENEVGSARMCERQISLRQSSERQSRRRPEKKRSEEGTSNVSEPRISRMESVSEPVSYVERKKTMQFLF